MEGGTQKEQIWEGYQAKYVWELRFGEVIQAWTLLQENGLKTLPGRGEIIEMSRGVIVGYPLYNRAQKGDKQLT